MERIFKIATKSNPDPNGLYPSERRYSASIVIGLSIVFFQLSACAILMGSLIIHKISVMNDYSLSGDTDLNNNISNSATAGGFNDTEEIDVPLSSSKTTSTERSLERRLESHTFHYYIDAPALICAGCFLMAFGCVLSFAAGVLAWKRWYIDHNITFFFLFSTFSILTSAICLLVSLLTVINIRLENIYVQKGQEIDSSVDLPPLTLSLASNIIILSFVTLIWSVISSRVGYRGMRNTYPEDMMVSKGGKIEVSTVKKGSKKCNTASLPPQILNNFKNAGKMAKYLPKKENVNNLPKEESNAEYQQRVNKFLDDEPESVNATENKV